MLVALIVNFSIRIPYGDNNTYIIISIGWILYFIEVGLVYYMVKFINDEPREFKDIFKFSNDFGKDL